MDDIDKVVRGVYTRVLHREPDKEGLENHKACLMAGSTVNQMISTFALSLEYSNNFIKGRISEDIITLLYDSILARNVDDTGLRAWSITLQTAGLPAVVSGIMGSLEYRQNFGDDCVKSRPMNEKERAEVLHYKCPNPIPSPVPIPQPKPVISQDIQVLLAGPCGQGNTTFWPENCASDREIAMATIDPVSAKKFAVISTQLFDKNRRLRITHWNSGYVGEKYSLLVTINIQFAS